MSNLQRADHKRRRAGSTGGEGGHTLKKLGAPLASRAFEEVLTEHLDALFRTALRLCEGREADAEDLLQDTALRAFDNYGQLREPSAARSWLFAILSRTHLNRVRTRQRRGEIMSTDLDEPAFEAALADWEPVPSPAETAEIHQLGEQLRQAVDALSPELRSVVLLVDVEGFAQREVAGMQGIPEGTVASRLFRARRQLRAVLEAPARDGRLWRRQ